MHTHAKTLQLIRQIHLYLGVFTAPAILFFALSGVLQTFGLHETTKDSSYKPARWILMMAQIHKKQTPQIPARKAVVQASAPALTATRTQTQAPAVSHNTLPLKIFFLLVGVALFTSTLSGLYMSWRYGRNALVTSALLLAGIVLPVILTVF